MSDMVNNPPHYKQGSIECIDAIRAALTPEEFRGYCKGNSLKYVWRELHKGGDESLKKAAWYLAQTESKKPEAVEWPEEDRRIDLIGQNGNDGEHYDDMSNPANWRPGDLLEPSPFVSGHCGSPAKFVRPFSNLSMSDKLAVDFPDGSPGLLPARYFKWLSRPASGKPEAVVCANMATCTACFETVMQGVRHICQ
ncbi:MAG: DUF3310 domain-containing protein [Pseudomonadaceae bacterium]|nr:DUF3310 domain-containing protein [Pseudomonadaceae bacterium]